MTTFSTYAKQIDHRDCIVDSNNLNRMEKQELLHKNYVLKEGKGMILQWKPYVTSFGNRTKYKSKYSVYCARYILNDGETETFNIKGNIDLYYYYTVTERDVSKSNREDKIFDMAQDHLLRNIPTCTIDK